MKLKYVHSCREIVVRFDGGYFSAGIVKKFSLECARLDGALGTRFMVQVVLGWLSMEMGVW